MISLEALYKTEGGEVTEKLSKRCSALLGRTDNTAVAVSQDIKDLYHKRSKILHGQPHLAHVKEVDVAKADLYAKASALAFLSLSAHYPHDEIIKNIDRASLSAREKRAIQRLVAKGFWGKAVLAVLSEERNVSGITA
jgi:hypothetical protein